MLLRTVVCPPSARILVPVLLLLLVSVETRAQDTSSPGPRRPGLAVTTQRNPRGADIVEPAVVLLVSRDATGRPDTAYVGTARIPDPRRDDDGALTNRDIETGTLIRLGGAWIYDEAGRRQLVQFDPNERLEIIFLNGPHDVVESRQNVTPRFQEPGARSVFDVLALYEGAGRAPVTDESAPARSSEPRTALLQMVSTYPGGEAVDLTLVLVPTPPVPAPVLRPVTIVQRDTIVLTPAYEVVVERPQEVIRMLTALVNVETGYGGSFTTTAVPATIIPSFASDGNANDLYFNAKMQFGQARNRWIVSAFGSSSINATDLVRIAHHQVALFADARFESGGRSFVLAQVSGQLRDKQYQEFDWNSADYAGSFFVGYGRRRLARSGVEVLRIQALAGMRMGENRPIEIMETRARARGIGPTARLGGTVAKVLRHGLELRGGSDAAVYAIRGRGHRDRGFYERGLLIHARTELGYDVRGAYVYGAVNLLLNAMRAEYRGGSVYTENKTMVAPGLGVEMRL